jgi:hypothetical protein
LPNLLGIEPISDVPDENAFVKGLGRITAPAFRDLFERGYHRVSGDFHLDRPGVVWTWNEFDHFRVGGIRDIDDRPAEMPQMAHIEIPASVRLHDGHLEARTIVEVAIANHTDILANAANGNRIGEDSTRQRRQQKQGESENGFCHC